MSLLLAIATIFIIVYFLFNSVTKNRDKKPAITTKKEAEIIANGLEEV